MIEKVKNVLKKRKAKLFFLFLFLSSLAWFMSNLSNRYEGRANFDLEFINPPDSMMLVSASKKNVDVKLNAVGFQFLMFDLGKRKLKINLSEVRQQGQRYYLGPESEKRQIEKQMTNGVKLLETEVDTLFFEFYDVITKKVPIKPLLTISFAQNYLLDGTVGIVPDSITLKGPKNEVGPIQFVQTEAVELPELDDDFSHTTKLFKAPSFTKTDFSEEKVVLSGKVSRFSEKVFHVPVQLINLPENTVAQTFPEDVSVVIKASFRNLKQIRISDIKVIGDYESVRGTGRTAIALEILEQPSNIHSAELSDKQVDFILKRE